jgi:stearoyl-CoA desaturase (delta-9 desaturase)
MLNNSSVVPIVCFFLVHWWGCVLMQTVFLHRYASHGMFGLSRGWERTFHLLTYLFQGSSYLVPRAYAHMHRAHHAYSDTDKDPHTPHRFSNVFTMMLDTKRSYSALVRCEVEPEPRFRGYVPVWPALERIADSGVSRIAWVVAYTGIYVALAPHWAWLVLLPVHFLMGPIHGAIVNWAGHKYGYRNFATRDQSRNVLPWDLVTLGELFQNNHHRHGQAPNFAQRGFEWDPAYGFIRLLSALGIADLAAKGQLTAEPGDDEQAGLPGGLEAVRPGAGGLSGPASAVAETSPAL